MRREQHHNRCPDELAYGRDAKGGTDNGVHAAANTERKQERREHLYDTKSAAPKYFHKTEVKFQFLHSKKNWDKSL